MPASLAPFGSKFLAVLFIYAGACDRTPEARPESAPSAHPSETRRDATSRASAATPSASAASTARPEGYRLPSRARVVAIGDIHGDLAALRRALQLAGATDSDDHWIGKDLAVVQTGDQLDRGDQDREVIDVLEKLEKEATAAGSALYVLNGNHELMNAQFDFRYVTPHSFASFNDLADRAPASAERLQKEERGRAAAFAPGGPYAYKLAQHLTVAVVGDSLFAHAGVMPAQVDYGLSRINAEAKSFLLGTSPELAKSLASEDSPVWTRLYGADVDTPTCQTLERVLKAVGVKRLVVGHTVQKDGISKACQDRLFRIDVGLSAYYGNNQTQVLELSAATAKILKGAKASGSADKKSAPHDSAVESAP